MLNFVGAVFCNPILCCCHIECDSASLEVLPADCSWVGVCVCVCVCVGVCVLAHWMHAMCASGYWVCCREGLQARQCDVTGVLGARGSAHCALGFKPSLCPAWHGRCVLLHRRGAGLPPQPADSLLPSCGHLTLVYLNGFQKASLGWIDECYFLLSHDAHHRKKTKTNPEW